MTQEKPPAVEPNATSAPFSRGERLARDVLYSLQIEKRPWVEVVANRRAVVMDTFKQFDSADEFEGMLAAQMAAAHSIFLGSSFLAVDKARPDRERAYYLRQAARLMGLYRQHFSLLLKCRKDREFARRAAAAVQRLAPVDPAPSAIKASAGKPPADDHSPAVYRAIDKRNPMGVALPSENENAAAKELAALPFAMAASTKLSRPLLMEGTALARALGP